MLLTLAKYSIFRILFFFTISSLLLNVQPLAAEHQQKHSYLELGITTTIMTTHPSVGYWSGHTGVRLTGMYLNPDHYEYHLNLGYEIRDTGKAQHSINLLTSWIAGSDPGADYNYAATGLAYSLNYRGFFVELGLAIPWQDNLGNLASNPVVPCGYWGYVYRFDGWGRD